MRRDKIFIVTNYIYQVIEINESGSKTRPYNKVLMIDRKLAPVATYLLPR